ncbi:MAG: hypothetical protein PHI85_03590 [Victivallaceae bacterium]|nr:hypothetical protein [Victivallaceae bacterium]
MKKGIFGVVLVLAVLIAVVAWLVNSGLRELPGEKLFKYAPDNGRASLFVKPGELFGSRFAKTITGELTADGDAEITAKVAGIVAFGDVAEGVLSVFDEDGDEVTLLFASQPIDRVIPPLLAADNKRVEKVEYQGRPAYRDEDGDYHVELEPGVILLNVESGSPLPVKKPELSKELRDRLTAVPPDAAAFFFGRTTMLPLPGTATPGEIDINGVVKFGENGELVLLAKASGLSDRDGELVAALPTLAKLALLRPEMSGVKPEQMALLDDLLSTLQLNYLKGEGRATLECVIPLELAKRTAAAAMDGYRQKKTSSVSPLTAK